MTMLTTSHGCRTYPRPDEALALKSFERTALFSPARGFLGSTASQSIISLSSLSSYLDLRRERLGDTRGADPSDVFRGGLFSAVPFVGDGWTKAVLMAVVHVLRKTLRSRQLSVSTLIPMTRLRRRRNLGALSTSDENKLLALAMLLFCRAVSLMCSNPAGHEGLSDSEAKSDL